MDLCAFYLCTLTPILRVIRLKGNLLTGNICRSWVWVLIIFKYFLQVSQSLSETRQVWSLKFWRQLKGKSVFVMMDFSFCSIRHWRTLTYPGGAQIKNAMRASKNGSWIYSYIHVCNQCFSQLTLWVRIQISRGALDTTFICDKNFQWLAVLRWFSSGNPVPPPIKLTAMR